MFHGFGHQQPAERFSAGSTPSAFTILPSNPTVVVNQSLQFSTTVDVAWSASCGSIGSTSGLYVAPGSTGSCTITATQTGGTHLTAYNHS